MNRAPFAIGAAALWIVCFEFLRNEVLFRSFWVERFASLSLVFETLLVNGVLWFVWSVLLAFLLHALLSRFSMARSILLVWIAFPMMWIAFFNLQVLPLRLLVFAVPLSLVEVAAWIIRSIERFGLKTSPAC